MLIFSNNSEVIMYFIIAVREYKIGRWQKSIWSGLIVWTSYELEMCLTSPLARNSQLSGYNW